MRDALQRPPIFNGLLERARKEGRLPGDLRRVLEEDFGVTPKASLAAATVFKDSGLVAGVLEPDGTLISSQISSKVTPMRRRASENEPFTQDEPRTAIVPHTANRSATQAPSRGNSREWSWNLPLDTGMGEFIIRLPRPISETDMAAVKKYADFYLEMIVRETRQLRKGA